MPNERAAKTAAIAEVNRNILDAARGSGTSAKVWHFSCECGRRACSEEVSLAIDEFVALHETGGAVLAPGHSLTRDERVRRAEEVRRRARRLRHEAQALVNEPDLQVRRAQQNLHQR